MTQTDKESFQVIFPRFLNLAPLNPDMVDQELFGGGEFA
jgi:hypothetical protein